MPDQVSEQTLILRHIKDRKKILLDKAFIALFGLPFMIDVFRECYKISINREGKDIFNFVCTSFSTKIEKEGKGIAQPIDKEKFSIDEYSQLITKCQMIARNMQQVSYEPPLDCDEIAMHLWVMYHYYENVPISWPPTIEDICLDFSFATLLAKAHGKIGAIFTHTERKEIMTRRSTETKIKKAEEGWKSFISAIYEHGEPIAPGTKLSEAIRMIQKQFEKSRGNKEAPWGEIPESKKKMPTPGRDSVITWLREEGILERDFEKRGRYWFKRM